MTDPLRARHSIWHIIRWIAVLPVATAVYNLLLKTLNDMANSYSLPVSSEVGYTTIFAVSILTAISAGALTAPRCRFQTACILTLLSAGLPICLIAFAVALGRRDDSVVPIVLSELAVGVIAASLFWQGGKGKV